MSRPFKTLASKPLMDRRIFTMREDLVENPRTGRSMPVTVLETNDWCNIIPVTLAGEVLLIRQWRFGTREVTIEIPGGIVDPGETPAEAAARELVEETGYRALRVIPTGVVTANPAILNNKVHSFLAYGIERAKSVDLDEGEDIEVFFRPVAEIPRMIATGEIDHAQVVAAFFHLANAAGGRLGVIPPI